MGVIFITDENIREFRNFSSNMMNSDHECLAFFMDLAIHYIALDKKFGELDHHSRLQIRKSFVIISEFRKHLYKTAVSIVNELDPNLYEKLELNY